ncbi:M48 family metallopeptidase [Aestuariibius insulae]|uniref:M48 family metallopeptidase n=1 Tax=Aestuariibius insulae TaxID=2058287 RepID=UPI00345EFD4C
MGRLVLAGNPPIDVVLRRSAAAKRMSLRISGLDGRVTLTVPRRVSDREARSFAQGKRAWLEDHLRAQPVFRPVGIGETVAFEGSEVAVRSAPVRAARLEDGVLLVPERYENAGRQVMAFLKRQADLRLRAACDDYAERIGRPYGRLTLRDTRSRWGSCSSRGDLMFSWRLMMAPADVLDYVAAHEVAHLVHMDHSARFWAAVEAIYPGFQVQRGWLRTHGEALHLYRFED